MEKTIIVVVVLLIALVAFAAIGCGKANVQEQPGSANQAIEVPEPSQTVQLSEADMEDILYSLEQYMNASRSLYKEKGDFEINWVQPISSKEALVYLQVYEPAPHEEVAYMIIYEGSWATESFSGRIDENPER